MAQVRINWIRQKTGTSDQFVSGANDKADLFVGGVFDTIEKSKVRN